MAVDNNDETKRSLVFRDIECPNCRDCHKKRSLMICTGNLTVVGGLLSVLAECESCHASYSMHYTGSDTHSQDDNNGR